MGHHHLHRPGHVHSHPKKELATRREFLSSMIAATVLTRSAFGQEQTRVDMAERFRQWSEEFETTGLAAPFKGITTDGNVIPGLFDITPTGISTEPIRNAAEKFIASLTSVQLARTMFPVDDIKWPQMDESALLRTPGHQPSGDERSAARLGLRPDARVPKRKGLRADP
jgi:hypothetical protein